MSSNSIACHAHEISVVTYYILVDSICPGAIFSTRKVPIQPWGGNLGHKIQFSSLSFLIRNPSFELLGAAEQDGISTMLSIAD